MSIAQFSSIVVNQSPSQRNNNLKHDPLTGLLFYISEKDVCFVDYFDYLKRSHVNQVSEKNDHQNSIRNQKSKEYEKDSLNFFNIAVNAFDLVYSPVPNQPTMLVVAQGPGIHLWEVSKNPFDSQKKEINYMVSINATKFADPKKGKTDIVCQSVGSFLDEKRCCAAVGCSNGEIFILKSNPGPSQVLTFHKSLSSSTHDKNSICALSSYSTSDSLDSELAFASGDSCGNVVFWNRDLQEIGHYNYPLEERLNEVATRVKKGEEFKKYMKAPYVSSISIKKNRIAVGYSNGEIVIFNSSAKIGTIGAHIRGVTSLVWHPKKDALISVSKDSLVHVWDFSNGLNWELTNSWKYPDFFITGATIFDEKLVLSIYGESKEALVHSPAETIFSQKKSK